MGLLSVIMSVRGGKEGVLGGSEGTCYDSSHRGLLLQVVCVREGKVRGVGGEGGG